MTSEKERVKSEKEPIIVRALSEEEMEEDVIQITGKHILYAGITILVIVCASGWFILNVKHKLESKRYVEMFKAAPDTLYAASFLIQSMGQSGILGNTPMPTPTPPQLLGSGLPDLMLEDK